MNNQKLFSNLISLRRLLGFSIIATLSANLLLLTKSGSPLPNDWGYFNSLALVVRSIVIQFHSFPFQNPWICGGLDILANPQNRIWSIFLLSDLLLPPQLANIFYLVFYGILGFIGMFACLNLQHCKRSTCLLGSFLFIYSNWFGLRFYEGHIPFGAMQLLPWVIVAMIKINNPVVVTTSALSAGLIMLDGIHYTIIFAFFTAVSCLFGVSGCWKEFKISIKNQKLYWLLGLLACTLIIAPKLLAVVSSVGDRKPVIEFFTMPPLDLAYGLFNPFRSIYQSLPSGTGTWRFHEFACYFSPITILTIIYTMFASPSYRKQIFPILICVFFWLWIGSGWLPGIHPWKLIHFIPLINNAHVQSRVFIIMFLFFVIAAAKAWESLERHKIAQIVIVVAVISEALIVRNFPATASITFDEPLPKWGEFIKSTTIEKTIPFAFTPAHYLATPNTGTSHCYEPSFTPGWIRESTHPSYKGEIWAYPPQNGNAKIISLKPGRIEFEYSTTDKAFIAVNANALFGWTIEAGNGTLKGQANELLIYEPKSPGQEIVTLAYQPPYFYLVGFCFYLGMALILFLFKKQMQTKSPQSPKGFSL